MHNIRKSMEKCLPVRVAPVVLALLLLVTGLWTGLGHAQWQASVNATPIDVDRGAAGLSRALRALRTRASILHITAHPDDEDGGMLVYETRGQGARTALLTLNRGEGGQNAMSIDLYDALGLVRTQELLMADRYYGVDQYWARAIDYGFSKTREEALDKWSHDRVLSDVVRVVRMTRPLVITSVFVGAASDGHGNHQVAGQMAQEAYLAAGDPAKFPAQIKEGLRPWTPLKVYARVPNFAVTKEGMYDYAIDKYVPVRFFDYVNQKASDTKPPATLEIPESDYAPAAGLTFWQIARTGWGFHKSQNGGGTTPPPTMANTAYHRYGSRVAAVEHEKSFFDGVDVSLAGIVSLAAGDTKFLKDGLEQISRRADEAFDQFAVDRPAAIAPALAEGLKATRALLDQVRKSPLADPGKADVLFELGVKDQQFQTALVLALGLDFRAAVAPERTPAGPAGPGPPAPQATFTIAIPGQSFNVEAKVFNPSPETLNGVIVLAPGDGKNWHFGVIGPQERTFASGKEIQWKYSVAASPDADLTRPYFTRPDEEQPNYDLTDERYRSLSLAPYPLLARAALHYHGVMFELH